MASRALLEPHFVDTRLVHLTSASGTLSDFPTHDKPTGELQKTEHSGLE